MSLGPLILNLLLSMVWIKVCGLVFSGLIVLRLGATRKFSEFWKEYWDWKYVRENTVNLVVWVVTLLGYAYSYHVLTGVPAEPLTLSFTGHPVASSYALGAALWLFVSTLLQTLSSVKRTAILCEKIGRPSFWVNLGKSAVMLSLFYLRSTSWPFMMGTLVGVVIPGLVIRFAVNRKLSLAIEQFLVLALIEYAFRVSVVLSALYAVTGSLAGWAL